MRLFYLFITLSFCVRMQGVLANPVSSRPSHYWIKLKENGSLLKRMPLPSSELSNNQYCEIPAEEKIYLSASPIKLTNGYFLINRNVVAENCHFSSGFVFIEHVAEVSATVEQEKAMKGFSFKVHKDTWLKRGTLSSDELMRGKQKCQLHKSESIKIQGPPLVYDEDHYVVNLQRRIPGCDFSQGIVLRKNILIKIPFIAGKSSHVGRRLANQAYRVAGRISGTGRCYMGVAQAMSTTFRTDAWSRYDIPGKSAYQFGRWANANAQLLHEVFQMQVQSISPWKAPVGSVFVYEPGKSGAHPRHGHIEIKVNKNLVCSDYCSGIYRQPSYIYVPFDKF